MALKDKLRFLRKRLNWTVCYTAHQSHLSSSIIHALEQGRLSNPELKTLWKLSDLFACPIDYLVDREPLDIRTPEPCPPGKNCRNHDQGWHRWWEEPEINGEAANRPL